MLVPRLTLLLKTWWLARRLSTVPTCLLAVLEEIVVNGLELVCLLGCHAHVVANHEPRQLRAIDQDELHRHLVSEQSAIPSHAWAALEPRRWRCGSVTSRTRRSCSTVQGGAESSPSESHLRTTGGDALQAAAACCTEKTEPFSICLRRLTTRTLAAFTAPEPLITFECLWSTEHFT
jgi:hypothetical protein